MSHDHNLTNPLPLYGEKPERPGLYLGLFHGRETPDEEMDAWGFEGPMIGPLRWVHTTYAFTICIEFLRDEDAIRYFNSTEPEQYMTFRGDLLAFGGQFFGDWSVYMVGLDECRCPRDTFRPHKRSDGSRTPSLCIN